MNELSHHGVLGMKWGVRRYQNKDGTLTTAGRRRYSQGEAMDASDKRDSSTTRKVKNDYNNLPESAFRAKYSVSKEVYRKRVNRYGDPYMNSPLHKRSKKRNKDVKDMVNALKTQKISTLLMTVDMGRKECEKFLSILDRSYKLTYDTLLNQFVLKDRKTGRQ